MQGQAVVVIPAVASIELAEAVAAPMAVRADGSVEVGGTLVLRVRANHDWTAVIGSDGDVRVRVDSDSGEFRSVSAGGVMEVGSGGRGVTVIRVDYRWVQPAGEAPAPTPLTYTLARI